MNRVNALKIRQSFGSVLKLLHKSDEPILIEKSRQPVGVLISMKMFKERFIDYREKKKRDELLRLVSQEAPKPAEDSLKVLRELRYGEDH